MCWLSGEPTIDEMLLDPTVITMMSRDGVEPDDVRLLIRDVSGRLKRDTRSTVQSPAPRLAADATTPLAGGEMLSDAGCPPYRSESPLRKRARFAGRP
jgi:hypothetical protein